MPLPKIYLGAVVKDGVLRHLSVTSLERFDPATHYGCERRWGYYTIDRLRPEEDTTARDVGTVTHEEIDVYQTTGIDRLGPVARAGRHLLYPPGPGILVEHESLGEISLAGVPFYVRLDLLNSRDYWIDDSGDHRPLVDAVEVQDWKTTGDIGKRALHSRGLLATVQMPVYALWSRTRFDLPFVRLSHSYFGTKRRESLKVSLLATRGEIDDRCGEIERVVERVKEAARAGSGVELAPDYDKCHRTYAGCPYLNICPRPALTGIRGLTDLIDGHTFQDRGDNTMAAPNLLDMLKLKNQTPAPTPAPAPTPVVGTVVPANAAPSAPAYTQAELDAAVARRMAELEAAKNVTLKGAEADKAAGESLPPGSAYITSAATAASVLPPDAPPTGSVAPKADPIPAETLATMSPAIQSAHAEVIGTFMGVPVVSTPIVGGPAADIPIPAPDPTPTPAPAPAEKTRKPRKPKSEASPGTSPEPDTGVIVTRVTVFADCLVSGLDLTPLDDYVEALLAKVCEHQGVSDVRWPVGKDSPLAFGGWRAIVTAMVKASMPPPGDYSIDTGGHEVRVEIVNALRSGGAVVARGAR